MRSFSRTCNEYRRFIKHFFEIARPLNNNIQKDKGLDWSPPTTEELHAFNTLASKLVEPLVLARPQPLYQCVCSCTRSCSSSTTKWLQCEWVGCNWLLETDTQSGGIKLLGSQKEVSCRGMGCPGNPPIHRRDIISSSNGSQRPQVDANLQRFEWKVDAMETMSNLVWLSGSVQFGSSPESSRCFFKTATSNGYSRLWSNRWWNLYVWVQPCNFGPATDGKGSDGHLLFG